MHNIVEERTGGEHIIRPVARQSIHSHPGCIFAGETMTRYGLPKYGHDHSDSASNEGIDEPDNVFSKPAQPITSSPRHVNYPRKNSLPNQQSSDSDDDDDDVLSKSAPAALFSPLHYSSTDVEETNHHQSNNTSYHSNHSTGLNRSDTSRNTSYRSDASRNASYRAFQYPEREHTLKRQNQCLESNNQWRTIVCYITAVVALIAVIYSSFFNTSQLSSVKYIYDEGRFYNDISLLGEKYNIDEDSILQVQSGISTISEKEDAGSFVFVYNGNARDFSAVRFNQFIHEVSLAAAKYLRNSSSEHTSVDASALDVGSHSELLCRYRGALAAGGVLLVRRLHALPAALAMAFHYYCDEYNPLVRKSAVFFTLDAAECPRGPGKRSPHAMIEKCLAEKWRGVPEESIGPLLTRVVNIVVDLSSVF